MIEHILRWLLLLLFAFLFFYGFYRLVRLANKIDTEAAFEREFENQRHRNRSKKRRQQLSTLASRHFLKIEGILARIQDDNGTRTAISGYFILLLITPFCLFVVAPFAFDLLGGGGGNSCADGWKSPSIGRPGACSHHGGVTHGPWFFPAVGAIILGIASWAALIVGFERVFPVGRKKFPEDTNA